MVKIRELHPLEENGKVDIEAWLATVQEKQPFSTEQIDQLRAACHLSYGAEQARTESDKRWADASCFHTGLEMASQKCRLRTCEKCWWQSLMTCALPL